MLGLTDSPGPLSLPIDQTTESQERKERPGSSQGLRFSSVRRELQVQQTPSPVRIGGRRPATSCDKRLKSTKEPRISNKKAKNTQAKVDSGLPKPSKLTLLKEFLSQQTPELTDSFSSLPTSTAEILTREELVRRRYDSLPSPYDALVLRLLQYYTQLDPTRFDREIELLKALIGHMDEGGLEGLKLLPELPADVLRVLHPSPDSLTQDQKSLLDSESDINTSLSLLTVRRIDTLRGLNRPSQFLQKVCSAYLCLFARADRAIEVTPGFHLVLSRAWDVWQNYIKQPGHVVQIARNVVYFVKTGKITPSDLREARSVLSELRNRGSLTTLAEETGLILLRFLESVDAFFTEWMRQNPQNYPKKPQIDLVKSSSRLSKSTLSHKTPSSQAQFQPSIDDIDLSAVIESPMKYEGEGKELRLPSFGPGQLNMGEGNIPALDFEAVIMEPLDKVTQGDVSKEGEELTTRFNAETPPKDTSAPHTSSEMAAEWELELSLRDLLQSKIQRFGGDLTTISSEKLQGEAWSHSAELFSELTASNSFHKIKEKLTKSIGLWKFEEIVDQFGEKMKNASFLKREIGKAVLRVKTDVERHSRQGKQRPI